MAEGTFLPFIFDNSMLTGSNHQYFLNTWPAELVILYFRHLKLELLTQFPASNDEKYLYFF